MEFLQLIGAIVVVGIVICAGYFIISLIGSIIAVIVYIAIGVGVIALVIAFIGELFICIPPSIEIIHHLLC